LTAGIGLIPATKQKNFALIALLFLLWHRLRAKEAEPA